MGQARGKSENNGDWGDLKLLSYPLANQAAEPSVKRREMEFLREG